MRIAIVLKLMRMIKKGALPAADNFPCEFHG
jgi:hypothetical protein